MASNNALAELAEQLEAVHEICTRDCTKETCVGNVVRKAKRIVAELDDVFQTYAFDPHGHSFLLLADRAVKKCRAIAEEGGAK